MQNTYIMLIGIGISVVIVFALLKILYHNGNKTKLQKV